MSLFVLEDLAKAIEDGDSSQVESLLTSGSIDHSARLPREHNPPPLVFAAQRCRARIVELLSSAGADINGVDDSGQTACFAAVWARCVDVLAVLLKHRPDLEIKDNRFDQTPLQLSLEVINREGDYISVMLINAGAALDDLPAGSLCWFASRSTAAIEALLNRGIAVSQLRDTETRNCTPLHAITSTRDRVRVANADTVDIVNMLVNVCGVDLEARNFDDETCTHIAARSGNDNVIRCFINAGADVNARDCYGRTPMHVVFDFNCTVLLLAAGANFNELDRAGRTAFELAMSRHHSSILPAFVAAGADPGDLSQQSVAAHDADRVETARREIAKERLGFVRKRAMQVRIGLQSLSLDALQMCEILQHSCGPLANLIAFHHWWTIATTVKHFQSSSVKHR
jgi:ankyrin repeat protein